MLSVAGASRRLMASQVSINTAVTTGFADITCPTAKICATVIVSWYLAWIPQGTAEEK
jgi:hypothetical protein